MLCHESSNGTPKYIKMKLFNFLWYLVTMFLYHVKILTFFFQRNIVQSTVRDGPKWTMYRYILWFKPILEPLNGSHWTLYMICPNLYFVRRCDSHNILCDYTIINMFRSEKFMLRIYDKLHLTPSDVMSQLRLFS